METPKVNPPVPTPSDKPQPSSGSTVGLAARVGASHGVGGTIAKPAASKPVAPGKGGRKSAEEEVSAYLASRGLQAVPVQTPGVAPVDPNSVSPVHVVTPEFVGDVTRELLKGIEAFRIRQVALKVKTLCGDQALAKEYAESSAAPPGCIDTTSKAMIEIAKKYPAMLQWAPEVTILATLGTWITKDVNNMKRLDELEKRLVDQFKARTASTTPAKPAAPPVESVPSS